MYAGIAFSPDRIVFVGDSVLMTEKKQSDIRRFFDRRNNSPELLFHPIRTDDVTQITEVLNQISVSFPSAVCDVSGGTDLLLVSVGRLASQKQLPVFFCNIHTNSYVNVSHCGFLSESFQPPCLSVEDLMILAGGSFIRHGHYSEELDLPEKQKIAEGVWNAIRGDMARWGRLAGYFQQAGKSDSDEEKEVLTVSAPAEIRVNSNIRVNCDRELMRSIEKAGAIRDLIIEGGTVSYRYESGLFKRLLSDAGVWLELYTYYTAKRTGFFDDIKTSVIIDWDGKEAVGTTNEVDDILMKGITPVFISCKIGVPSVLAINEIEFLTRRFGGSMAKASLVTACPLREIPASTRQRAADMDVELISVENLTREEFAEKLKALSAPVTNYYQRTGPSK